MSKKPETQGVPATDTAVATVEAPSQAVAEMAPGLAEMEQFAGAGLEKVTSKDVLIPRLTILQALSPQLNAKKAAWIEGAKIGEICDVGTNEIMDAPLVFLPVLFDKVWLEWAPRSTGKGLVAVHSTPDAMDATKLDDKKRPLLPNGNLISETSQFYGLNLSAGRRPSFIPFASTQIRKARRWITLAKGERMMNSKGQEFTPPLFYRTYHLTTAMESNNDGDWAGWVINRGVELPAMDNWKNILADAIVFRDSVIAGIMQGDVSSMADDGGTTIDGTAEREGGGERAM